MLAEQRDCATALEEAGISFVLLKGAVIRSYYPEPWMRTSSDIDLLIHPKDLDAAMAILQQKLEYSFVCRSAHDVSLESPSGVHLELHFTLIESLRAKESTDVLEQVWSFATPKSEGCTEHILSTGMYYYYHIAHMAKHFINGGCGIRTFIDLYIMESRMSVDAAERESLLTAGKLKTFADRASELSRVWFCGADHNGITQRIEEYILPAGVYGVIDKMVAARTGHTGSRLGYILSRIFLPYSELKNRYPKMGRYKILLPLLQIRRWLALLNPARGKRAQAELKSIGRADAERLNETARLIEELDI